MYTETWIHTHHFKWSIDSLRQIRGDLFWTEISLYKSQPLCCGVGGEDTWLLLCPCWLYMGDTRMKMIKTPREVFNLSLVIQAGEKWKLRCLKSYCHSAAVSGQREGGRGWCGGVPRLNLCHLPNSVLAWYIPFNQLDWKQLILPIFTESSRELEAMKGHERKNVK